MPVLGEPARVLKRTDKAKRATVIEKSACRLCGGSHLRDVLDLGKIQVSNFAQAGPGFKAPLEIAICDPEEGGCGLVQLKHTVSTNMLYRHYWYRSGVNRTMTKALANISNEARKRVKLAKGDIVIDIGCNDGTLLKSYPTWLRRVGFEPAGNLAPLAAKWATRVINSFFNHEEFERHYGNERAKIITAIAMFYDLDDPHAFVADLVECLHPDGIAIIQQNYLPMMLKYNAFDNVVHEHLEYYSLGTLERLLELHGLVVEDVELNDVNGGSFRVYVRHRDYPGLRVSNRVRQVRRHEKRLGLGRTRPYIEFSQRVSGIRRSLLDIVARETKKGKRVYIYGASTRGNTLLQYCGLDHRLIKAAVERNPEKWGKRIVGTGIPIISEERARDEMPEYFLVLPWQFLPEFLKREHAYLKKGGRFIVPFPRPRVVGLRD